MIHVYTGDGKGKTTASLGLLLRAVGAGKRVAFVQFDKGGTHYSERKVLAERFPEVTVVATGLDRINPVSGKFRMGVTDEDKREGERGLIEVERLFKESSHDVFILDELNSSLSLGILDQQRTLEVLKQAPTGCELLLTGRNAPQYICDLADLQTEMRLIEHYFYHGTKAREGIDF